MTSIGEKYDAFYGARDAAKIYPVEFVVRALLGAYPRLKPDRSEYSGRRVLDLGFGDGRNMPLLCDQGMEVYGVEITEEICRAGETRLAALGYSVKARVGRNAAIPFGDGYFDHILACHSCYYVDEGQEFSANVAEIARTHKPGGRFILSAPCADSYIMAGATDLGDGHMRIANDPYGVRNGCILKSFASADDLAAALQPHYRDIQVGAARNDWWGIEERVFIASCRRA
jgi:SAM-dependent methyltransferase